MFETKFRSCPKGGFPEGVFESTLNPLILIKAVRYHSNTSGITTFAKKVSDKIDLLKDFKEYDLLILVWTGKISSDVFELDIDLINSLIKKYD